MAEEKKEDKKVEEVKKAPAPKINLQMDKPVFSWQAPEYHRPQERNNRKLLLVILAAIVIAIVFGWQGQWSSVAVVVAAVFVLLVISRGSAKIVKCAIYSAGVVVDNNIYNFDQFKSFWLLFTDRYKIRLQRVGRFGGQVTLPLSDNEDPEQIRIFLQKHLPEEEDNGRDLNDIINHWLRF